MPVGGVSCVKCCWCWCCWCAAIVLFFFVFHCCADIQCNMQSPYNIDHFIDMWALYDAIEGGIVRHICLTQNAEPREITITPKRIFNSLWALWLARLKFADEQIMFCIAFEGCVCLFAVVGLLLVCVFFAFLFASMLSTRSLSLSACLSHFFFGVCVQSVRTHAACPMIYVP